MISATVSLEQYLTLVQFVILNLGVQNSAVYNEVTDVKQNYETIEETRSASYRNPELKETLGKKMFYCLMFCFNENYQYKMIDINEYLRIKQHGKFGSKVF